MAYPAGAQEGRHLRFPPSCESPLSLGGHGGDGRTETIKERQRIFSAVGEHSVLPFLYLFAVSDTVLLHIWFTLRRARHSSAAQFFCALYRLAPANLSIRYNFILVGAVCNLQTNELRDTGMSRLRRLSGLCGSNVSGTANRLRKTRKKKSSAVPLFEAVACRQFAPDYLTRER